MHSWHIFFLIFFDISRLCDSSESFSKMLQTFKNKLQLKLLQSNFKEVTDNTTFGLNN